MEELIPQLYDMFRPGWWGLAKVKVPQALFVGVFQNEVEYVTSLEAPVVFDDIWIRFYLSKG